LRRSSILTISAVSCVLFGVAAIRLNSRFSSAQAAAQTAQPVPVLAAGAPQSAQAQIKPVSATVPTTVDAADARSAQLLRQPGIEIYTAKRGETIPAVAHRYLKETSYLTSSELAEAIRGVNGKLTGNVLKAGQQITIPGILPASVVEKTVPVDKDFEVRAIYLTGVMAASDHGLRIIRHWREVGGNAVVFDIKDSDGGVNIPFEHPLLGKRQV